MVYKFCNCALENISLRQSPLPPLPIRLDPPFPRSAPFLHRLRVPQNPTHLHPFHPHRFPHPQSHPDLLLSSFSLHFHAGSSSSPLLVASSAPISYPVP